MTDAPRLPTEEDIARWERLVEQWDGADPVEFHSVPVRLESLRRFLNAERQLAELREAGEAWSTATDEWTAVLEEPHVAGEAEQAGHRYTHAVGNLNRAVAALRALAGQPGETVIKESLTTRKGDDWVVRAVLEAAEGVRGCLAAKPSKLTRYTDLVTAVDAWRAMGRPGLSAPSGQPGGEEL